MSAILYFHLKMTFHLTKRNIPERVEEFDEALKFIFKDGAAILEKLILRRLCETLRVRFNEDDTLDFAESIFEIKRAFSSNVTLIGGFGSVSRWKRRWSENLKQRANVLLWMNDNLEQRKILSRILQTKDYIDEAARYVDKQ